MRTLEFLWKTRTSQTNNCPALYRTDGGYVVQGKALDSDTRAALRDLDVDEDAIFVPADVLDRLVDLRKGNA